MSDHQPLRPGIGTRPLAGAVSKQARRLAVRARRNRRLIQVCGLVLLLAGGATLAYPAASTVLIGALAGWLLWLAGAVMILVGLVLRPHRFAAALAAGLACVAAGVFMFVQPTSGALALGLLVTAVLVMDGALELALALDLRPLGAWRWILASALASLVAALVAGSGALGGSVRALAGVLGLAFAASGLALIASVSALPARRRQGRGGSMSPAPRARNP